MPGSEVKQMFKKEFKVGKVDGDVLTIEINFNEKGALSITGWSDHNGGQCYDLLTDKNFVPGYGWTAEKCRKLQQIWIDWHLNDMHPYCPHQKAAGIRERAMEEVKIYHWYLDDETEKMKKSIIKEANHALSETGKAELTANERYIYNLPDWCETYNDEKAPEHYKAWVKYGKKTHIETKRAGHTWEKEGGILGETCPVCGYSYGGEWQFEPVPEDIVEWLRGL